MTFTEKIDLTTSIKRLRWSGTSEEQILAAVREALGSEPEEKPRQDRMSGWNVEEMVREKDPRIMAAARAGKIRTLSDYKRVKGELGGAA